MGTDLSYKIAVVTTIGASALLILLTAVGVGVLSLAEPSVVFAILFFLFFVVLGFGITLLSLFLNSGSQQSGEQGHTVDTTEQTETPLTDLRDDGDDAVSDAVEARADGNLSAAVDYYTEAIELYHTAAEVADDSETQDEIEETIQQLQTDRSAVEAFQDARQSLMEALQAGEENFQTAIVAHCQGEQTLSRIRYRQAREQFANAVDELEASEMELLQTPVHVSVASDVSLPSQQLASLSGIDADTVEILNERGVATIDELQQVTNSAMEPLAAVGLENNDSVSTEAAAKLTALCWWDEDATHTFRDSDSISRRHELAVAGFKAI